jgi:uncharacterized 2Fe-2S/4Fe-4S cluster protein (DUF4445 family)
LPKKKEAELLGGKALEKGYRLACYHKINADIDIYPDNPEGQAVIAQEGMESTFDVEPFVSKLNVKIDLPDINDQRSLVDRVLSASNGCKTFSSLQILGELPETLKNYSFDATLISMDRKIISVEQGNTEKRLFGVAFDIGTTTIVGYLADIETGSRIAAKSTLNPQRIFGADVISRINHTGRSQEAMNEMNRLLMDCINDLINRLAVENGLNKTDIYLASFVGNTTMMHFLMNVPAYGMAISPFIPVTTDSYKIKASEIGLRINRNGFAMILPSVSAYIGADTVAAVLLSRMYKSKKITLLIDIGTNGEIVLGNSKWMYSCSTAAGPAFEGASIRNGIGGIEGAIDRVSYDGKLEISTIGAKKAVGICGSGIVDVVSMMLEKGIALRNGRINEPEEILKTHEDLARRVVSIDGVKSFLLLGSEECDAGSDIAITQKDIRELQTAKGAIAAGIRILAAEAGIGLQDIDRVYMAGGFGSYMNIESAHTIGLIPIELAGKVTAIGNAAGAGALQALLSKKLYDKAQDLKKRVKYIELSSSGEFMDQYIECMNF